MFNKGLLGVFDGRHGLGAKVSAISLFQWMKCISRKTILHYSKKCPFIIDERFCLEGSRVNIMSSFSYWLIEEEWGSQSSSSHLQGFSKNVYTNLKSFRISCDTQASLLLSF